MDKDRVTEPENKNFARARAYVNRKNVAIIIAITTIVLISLGVRLYNILGAGITNDEVAYVRTAAGLIKHLGSQSLFSISTWAGNSEQPPVGKYIYAIAIYLFNGSRYDLNAFAVSKVASALMGTATCVLVYLIGRKFFNERVGLLSGLILALIPPFIAHSQIAALDSPVALFFTMTVYLFMTGVKTGSAICYAGSALAMGLLIDSKFNGALVIPLIVLFYLYYRYKNYQKLVSASTMLWAVVYGLVVINVIIWLWPYLWADPIILAGNPLAPLQETLEHWTYHPQEYFLGIKQLPPIHYYPVYFLVTTPLLLLPLLAIGLNYSLKSKDPFKVALVLWLAVPFLYGFSGFIQDGIRYVLMIFPAVAILSAAGLLYLVEWISGRWKADTRLMWCAASALVLLYLLMSIIAIGPYYLDYYNSISGGQKNIAEHRLLEIGWWGEGMTDAVQYVEGVANPGSTVLLMGVFVEPEVSFLYYAHNLTYLVPDGLKLNIDKYDMRTGNFSSGSYSNTLDQALNSSDYIIFYPYDNWHKERDVNATRYQLVHETLAGGASICRVYKMINNCI